MAHTDATGETAMNDEPKKELTPYRLISRHRAALMGFCIL
jgi:hypothetical protein